MQIHAKLTPVGMVRLQLATWVLLAVLAVLAVVAFPGSSLTFATSILWQGATVGAFLLQFSHMLCIPAAIAANHVLRGRASAVLALIASVFLGFEIAHRPVFRVIWLLFKLALEFAPVLRLFAWAIVIFLLGLAAHVKLFSRDRVIHVRRNVVFFVVASAVEIMLRYAILVYA